MKLTPCMRGIAIIVLLVCSVVSLPGCSDGSSEAHKRLIGVSSSDQDPAKRAEALGQLTKLPLTKSSFNAFVNAMNNDKEESVRNAAAFALRGIVEKPSEWQTAGAEAIDKAALEGRIPAKYRGTLWEVQNPEDVARVKAEIEKQVNAPVILLQQELAAAKKISSFTADGKGDAAQPAQRLRKERAALVERVAKQLLAEDQKRPPAERKYNAETARREAEKSQGVAKIDEEIAGLPDRAAAAAKDCGVLEKEIAQAEARVDAARKKLYDRGLESLYFEWFGE